MNDINKNKIQGAVFGALIVGSITAIEKLIRIVIAIRKHKALRAQNRTSFTPEHIVEKTKKDSFPAELNKVLYDSIDILKQRNLANQPYALFDMFFRKLSMMSLAADSGVGKTFLALQVALYFRNVLYLAFDDRTGAQMVRFNACEAFPKMTILNGPQLRSILKGVHKFAENESNSKGEAEYAHSDAAKIETNRKKSMKEVGLKIGEHINNLWLYNLIIHAPEFADCDLIIIDKIGDLVGGIPQMTEENLEKVFYPAIETNKSLLLITETNKKGELAGNNAFSYWLDESVFLSDLGNNTYCLEHLKNRYSIDGKHIALLNKVSTGENSAYFELSNDSSSVHVKSDDSNIPDRILEIIGEKRNIDFKVLWNTLAPGGVKSEESVKNALRKLKKDGKVRMANGKTWDIIECVMPVDSETKKI
ncbi:hypothetical protein [Treponema primitia]|uniref:hypothetical protein n=1 Tax=Treponema primitia TaxID=88058 RepID=UPI000255586F|nr:hypothetical protein [Treponema primitia]